MSTTIINILVAGYLIWIICKYLDLKKSLKPREKRYLNLIEAVSSITDCVEEYSSNHSEEVSMLALKIADKTSMTKNQKISLSMAAKLHDIGMLIATSDVIKSRRKINDNDASAMHNHPLLAEHYLKKHTDVTEDISSIIRWHHERWDGFGYPDNLVGTQIPLAARILTIADAISSMKAERPYRRKAYKSNQEIILELKRESGLQFDPSLVKIAVSLLEEEK